MADELRRLNSQPRAFYYNYSWHGIVIRQANTANKRVYVRRLQPVVAELEYGQEMYGSYISLNQVLAIPQNRLMDFRRNFNTSYLCLLYVHILKV